MKVFHMEESIMNIPHIKPINDVNHLDKNHILYYLLIKIA